MTSIDSEVLEPTLYELFVPVKGGYKYIERLIPSFPKEKIIPNARKLGVFHGLELSMPVVGLVNYITYWLF